MPELPEVETFARGLNPRLKGKRILDVLLFREKNIVGDPDEFKDTLKGKTILGVSRRGKYLIFSLSEGYSFLSHLRMEGRWKKLPFDCPIDKHRILSMVLDDNSRLDYVDTRKFGTLELKRNKDVFSTPPLSLLGPEPLDVDFETFKERIQSKNTPIKEALMDQTILAGIGNIYADESLYKAKIHPFEPASNLDDGELKTLYQAIRTILNLAISLRGSSVHSYVPTFETEPASMQERLLVYGRAHEPCEACGTPLTYTKLNGRGTTYCPICQKRKNAAFVLAITGPIHAGKSIAGLFFETQGFAHFDADMEVKKLYKQADIQKTMKEILGKKAIVKKQVNAPYLRDLFAKNPLKKKEWMDYLYPKLEEAYLSFYASNKNTRGILLDVPLLLDSPFLICADAILLIDADIEARKQRLIDEGRDVENLMKINASYPLKQTKKIATFVIENNGGLGDFVIELNSLLHRIQLDR